MRIGSGGLLIALFGLCSATVWGQTATFNVDKDGKLSAVDSALASSKELKAKTPLSLAITCEDNGCKEVKATADGAPLDGISPTETNALFRIAKGNVKNDSAAIVVTRSANATFAFKFTSTGDLASAGSTGSQPSLEKEYARCARVPRGKALDDAHQAASSVAEPHMSKNIDGINRLLGASKGVPAVFIVTPLGAVLQRPAHIDEGQVVVVSVYATAPVLDDLIVKRTSVMRTPDVFRAVGGDTDISGIKLQSLTEEESKQCEFRSFVLGDDFAPGTAAFELRSAAAQKAVGSVEFGVDALYSGLYSLGAVRSKNVDPDFYLASDGATQTIRQRNLGGRDVFYSVMYTPFVWGKRSLQESPRFRERFNPTVGLALNDVSDNFIFGVSFDLGGFVLTYGKHWRKSARLDPSANLAPGSTFGGTMEQLPVGKEWDDENFVSLTIDLRAAAGLFTKALQKTN